MEALTLVMAGLIALLLFGALASAFGADSREGMEDTRLDPPLPLIGGAR